MQIVLNGFIAGLGIAVLATAFQAVYLTTRIFFAALAGLYTIAPYVYLAAYRLGDQWLVGAIASAVVVILISLLIELLNHGPLSKNNASEGAHLVSSLGIYILLVQIIAMIWGNETQTMRIGLDPVIRLGDALLTQSQVVSAVTAGALLSVVLIVSYFTGVGLRLRAFAESPVQFVLYGYNARAYRFLAFGVAGFLAVAASLPFANDLGFTPRGGLNAVLLAVVSVIVGGRSSIVGPIIAGVFIGLLRAQVVWYTSARWQEAATFVLLGFFLLLRPSGLLGPNVRVRAMQ